MKRKIKMVEQTEHSECGLACATMILNYEGINILIIPGLSEPPVRTLRATIPGNESQLKFLILDD